MSSHVEVGKGSIGARLSTICFLQWALIRQSGYIEDIRKGSCSLKSFLGVAGEGIDERESSKFEEGLNSKVNLSFYRTFGKVVEFKKYLRGASDAGRKIIQVRNA